MKKRIDGKKFLDAFKKEWEKLLQHDEENIRNSYPFNDKWTDYFVTGENSFLEKVMLNLREEANDLNYWRELYNIDASFIGGKELIWGNDNLLYPSIIYALIEHENAGVPEEEVWKLAYRRSPLKVTIFYDYHEHEKASGRTRDEWVPHKLASFNSIINEINGFCGKEPEVEYLFIIGNKESEHSNPRWRYINEFPLAESRVKDLS